MKVIITARGFIFPVGTIVRVGSGIPTAWRGKIEPKKKRGF